MKLRIGRSLSIVTSGRLGNQLFQWALMHQIIHKSSLNEKSVFSMLEMQLPTNGHRNRLMHLVNSCPHIRIKKAKKSLKFKMKIVEKLDLYLSREAIDRVSSFFGLKYERLALSDNFFPKRATYIGYFQDVRQFVAVLPILLGELSNAIQREKKWLLEKSLMNKILGIPFQLLHIRGGDYQDVGNEGFGLLHKKYFIENLDLGLRTIVITDDPTYAWDSTVKFIPNAIILNPEEFDEWCALSVASLCSRFIGSNSTFSYWCALLANYNGATALLPKPFNKSGGGDPETLQVSGLKFVEAWYL
jgi:hypothetical protein